ncbi:hypothetical protein LK540_14875 [Massilia sp. IC2-278]|uniref:hypothetical protein n=1 Tax=Massilia sp. IC2-278 TaxID=2887200 RepID=UPI001E5346BE|nr:hypothetical protein [Massilia sp. IC2-278]MCC2961712.1 hypothetical protein [Massilia sp. IC2-278]
MRSISVAAVFLLSLLNAGAALAQKTILLGTIDKLEFVKEGTEYCPVTCPNLVEIKEDGTRRICLSRHGDCQLVSLRVIEVLAGTSPGPTVVGKSKLGEFGRPTIPMETRQVVAEIDEQGYASYIGATYSNDGVLLQPKSWAKVDGIDLVPMKNEHGVVPLELLRQRLREKR